MRIKYGAVLLYHKRSLSIVNIYKHFIVILSDILYNKIIEIQALGGLAVSLKEMVANSGD